MRISFGYIAAAVVAVGCSPSPRASDTTSGLAAIDTVKPAPGMAAQDTVTSLARVDTPRTATGTKTRATKTATRATATTKTKTPVVQARDTAHLGRDSVIRIDPRDPRRQLPTVPPKKPPQ